MRSGAARQPRAPRRARPSRSSRDKNPATTASRSRSSSYASAKSRPENTISSPPALARIIRRVCRRLCQPPCSLHSRCTRNSSYSHRVHGRSTRQNLMRFPSKPRLPSRPARGRHAMRRRALAIALILMLLCAYTPAHPAFATSTGGEIQAGQQTDRQVQDSYTVIKDPLENAWVNDVAKRLWAQVARKDLPYSIKVTRRGRRQRVHDRRRLHLHQRRARSISCSPTTSWPPSSVTRRGTTSAGTSSCSQNKATIANVLFSIGSLFSPWIYQFGQLAEAGLFAKWSRQDESEADAYGLLLMTRAGYDPYAAVSFMQHLNATHAEHNSIIDKLFRGSSGCAGARESAARKS